MALAPLHAPGKRWFIIPCYVYVPSMLAVQRGCYWPHELKNWPRRLHWLERKHVFWLWDASGFDEPEIPCVWSNHLLCKQPCACEDCAGYLDAEGNLWPV